MRRFMIVAAVAAVMAGQALAQDSVGDLTIQSPVQDDEAPAASPTIRRAPGVSRVDSGTKAYTKTSNTVGNLVEQGPVKAYGAEEAKGLVKEELELVQVLLGMHNHEEARHHVEKAVEIAQGNSELRASLEGLLKDLHGGSSENANLRISEILAGL